MKKESRKKCISIFLSCMKIGLFTFGGGYAMISLIEKEFVQKKKWISEEELMEMITVSESTPGPIAINIATYVGYKCNYTIGAFLATLGVIIPSFIIILMLSLFLKNFLDYPLVKHAFVGLNCAVGVMIFTSGLNLWKTMKKDFFSYLMFAVTLISLLAVFYFDVNLSVAWFIIFGGVTSLLFYTIQEKKKGGKIK